MSDMLPDSVQSTRRIESDLSFSWYCRRPLTDTVAGTAARTGDAIFGLADVATIRPARGTAAATLLNIVRGCVC